MSNPHAQQTWQHAKEHYNQQANKHLSTAEAIQQRNSGAAKPLKDFHNTIKRSLLRRFAFNAPALLDLACGRGGDLQKWNDCRVTYVRGYDIAEQELVEARRRYDELLRKGRCEMQVEFMENPSLGAFDWREPIQYDVVTCMFAIHYFFASEDIVRTLLYNVAQNLKDGGFFIGTVPDGKAVLALLRNNPEYRAPMLKLAKRWNGEPQSFGSAFTCAIADTVTQDSEGSEGSLEYLVFTKVFIAIAGCFGLVPVTNYEDPDMEQLFKPEDRGQTFKHFNPNFPDSDISLEHASSMFTAFVFQKLAPGARPRLPARPPSDMQRGRGGGGRGGGGGGPGRGRMQEPPFRGGGGPADSGGSFHHGPGYGQHHPPQHHHQPPHHAAGVAYQQQQHHHHPEPMASAAGMHGHGYQQQHGRHQQQHGRGEPPPPQHGRVSDSYSHLPPPPQHQQREQQQREPSGDDQEGSGAATWAAPDAGQSGVGQGEVMDDDYDGEQEAAAEQQQERQEGSGGEQEYDAGAVVGFDASALGSDED